MISGLILVTINISATISTVERHTLMFSQFSEFRAVANLLETDRTLMTIRRMSIACWITKATNTQSECVTLIVFPLQQWLHERASMLSYTYSTLSVLLQLKRHGVSVLGCNVSITKFQFLRKCVQQYIKLQCKEVKTQVDL